MSKRMGVFSWQKANINQFSLFLLLRPVVLFDERGMQLIVIWQWIVGIIVYGFISAFYTIAFDTRETERNGVGTKSSFARKITRWTGCTLVHFYLLALRGRRSIFSWTSALDHSLYDEQRNEIIFANAVFAWEKFAENLIKIWTSLSLSLPMIIVQHIVISTFDFDV